MKTGCQMWLWGFVATTRIRRNSLEVYTRIVEYWFKVKPDRWRRSVCDKLTRILSVIYDHGAWYTFMT